MNPLAEFVEKLKRAAVLNYEAAKHQEMETNVAFFRGCQRVYDSTAEELTALLPALENLITWSDGAPTEDGEYLVEVDESFLDLGGEMQLYFGSFVGGDFFAASRDLCTNGSCNDIPVKRIRRHAKLKV